MSAEPSRSSRATPLHSQRGNPRPFLSAFSRLARHHHAPLRERVPSTPTPARVQGLIRVGPASAANSRSASPCVTAGLGGSASQRARPSCSPRATAGVHSDQCQPASSTPRATRGRFLLSSNQASTRVPYEMNPNSFPKNQSKLPNFFPKLNM